MQRPEVIVNMTTAILERLDPAILDGIDYLRRPNKPTLAERYYDKRSNYQTCGNGCLRIWKDSSRDS